MAPLPRRTVLQRHRESLVGGLTTLLARQTVRLKYKLPSRNGAESPAV